MENLTGGTPPVRYLPCVVPCKLYFYKGKTIADVKAVVEAGQDPNTLIDIEDDYDPFETDVEYTDTSAIYHLRKGYLYRVSVSSTEESFPVPENFYFCVD